MKLRISVAPIVMAAVCVAMTACGTKAVQNTVSNNPSIARPSPFPFPPYPQIYADRGLVGQALARCDVTPDHMVGPCRVVAVEGGAAFGTALQDWLDSRGPTAAHIVPGATDQKSVEVQVLYAPSTTPRVDTLPIGMTDATFAGAIKTRHGRGLTADCLIEPDGAPKDCWIVTQRNPAESASALALLNSGKLRYAVYASPKISKRRIVRVLLSR